MVLIPVWSPLAIAVQVPGEARESGDSPEEDARIVSPASGPIQQAAATGGESCRVVAMLVDPAAFHALVSGQRRGIGPWLARGGLRLAELPYTVAMRLRNWRYDTGKS